MICDKNKCSGCGLCEIICPKQAIKLKKNNEGFLYPTIDKTKCINCNLCKRKCPSINYINENDKNDFYMAWSKNKKIVRSSSSGGIFTEIASTILEDNGIVVGCEIKNNELEHIVIKKTNELDKIKGSKYIQSDIRKVLPIIKESLSNKIKVLFCGCPCQVAAVNNYVSKEEKKYLYTIDIICHGVAPTPFFKKHIGELEKKYNSKLVKYIFRNNSKEWRKYVVEYNFESNKKIQKLAIEDPYMACYLKCAIYRESCYNCKYSKIPRIGDITLGDYSGVDVKTVPKHAIKDGISAIIINSEKGLELFKIINKNLIYKRQDINDLIKTNKNLISPCERPKSRDKIFKDNLPISELQKKYCKYKLTSRIVNHIFSVETQNKLRKMR